MSGKVERVQAKTWAMTEEGVGVVGSFGGVSCTCCEV